MGSGDRSCIVVESHIGEILAAWAPGAKVGSAEEPTLQFTDPGPAWFLFTLLSLPALHLRSFFSLMGKKPGGLLLSHQDVVFSGQCFLQCFFIQQKSQEVMSWCTWGWSSVVPPLPA